TDHQVGVFQFQFAPAAQLREHFVLGFFANRAGIEQDHVGIFSLAGDFQGLVFAQQVHHARAVVLVHLATVGFDIKLLGRECLRIGVFERTADYRGVLVQGVGL